MRRSTRSTSDHLALFLLASVGCVDRYDPFENDTGQCEPGGEGCACLDGLCQFGLACEDDVCVNHGGEGPPPPDPSDGTGDDGVSEAGDDGMGGTPGSCDGRCGSGVPDGDGMCFCTATCAGLGTCCSDYEEACPVQEGCAIHADCPADDVCSLGTGECVSAYGHVYDLYVEFEDTTGFCWDEPGACAADPYVVACFASVGSCECMTLIASSEPHPDTSAVVWQSPVSIGIDDGNSVMFWVVDYDTAESPYGPGMMPSCCAVAFQGPSGIEQLRVGEGSCQWSGGELRTTFVAE